MDHHSRARLEQDASPLSPTARILSLMLARYGSDEDRQALLEGPTFGSTITLARKALRITVRKLLEQSPALNGFDEATWNELEQDRFDPRALEEDVLAALHTVLGIQMDELRRLCDLYDKAYEQQERLWTLLTLEAHAFRARKARD